jgi:branched-chain amino acid transport system ATP-binding protein
VKVLHGVSLELHAGEVVCIIGPNGAGKTTLLRTISGLCRPTGGAIAFKGEALAGAKPHQMARRGLGHCPEGRRVFQHLSIEENLIAGFLPGRGKARTTCSTRSMLCFRSSASDTGKRPVGFPAASSRCWRSAGR